MSTSKTTTTKPSTETPESAAPKTTEPSSDKPAKEATATASKTPDKPTPPDATPAPADAAASKGAKAAASSEKSTKKEVRDVKATAKTRNKRKALETVSSATDAATETPSSIWDFKGHLATATGLLRKAQEAVEAGKAQLNSLGELKAVRVAVQWWKERDTRPADQPDDARATVERLELLARNFEGFIVPLAGHKIALGADLVLNFIPGGQWISAGAHGYIICEAIRFGAPWKLIQTMVGRMTVDGALSTIPVAGPIYDALRMAHSKNARDLSEWLSDQLVLSGQPAERPSPINPAVAEAIA